MNKCKNCTVGTGEGECFKELIYLNEPSEQTDSAFVMRQKKSGQRVCWL